MTIAISEEFKAAVIRNVRQESNNEDIDLLGNDLQLWFRCLVGLKRDVEIQFVAQKSRLTQTKRDYLKGDISGTDLLDIQTKEEAWKVGAVRFAASIEDQILYVKDLLAEHNVAA